MMHTGVVTLTEFLLARISEDEERAQFVARQVEGNNWGEPFEPWMLSWHDEYDLLCVEPSRALAECGAKRSIVEAFEEDRRLHLSAPDQFTEAAFITGLLATARLATIYADHPDYREEWRP